MAELTAKVLKELTVETSKVFIYESVESAVKYFKSYDTPTRKIFMSNCYF